MATFQKIVGYTAIFLCGTICIGEKWHTLYLQRRWKKTVRKTYSRCKESEIRHRNQNLWT